MDPGVVLFVLIIVSGILIFYYLKIKNYEVIARIEHGLEPQAKDPKRFIKMGILCIAVGLGLLAGYFAGEWTRIPFLVTVPSSILFLGGGSLLFFNRLD